jgi:glycosyltransferase involved in cell wall biosynthesis
MYMTVSVITPTFQRQGYLAHLVRFFSAQTYPHKELLIWDDSPEPCGEALQAQIQALQNVRYIHWPERLSVGAKRNKLIAEARGEIIVHFDDDDYYAPSYLQTMVDYLAHADFVTLSAWYAYRVSDAFFGYWDTATPFKHHFKLAANDAVSIVDGDLMRQPDYIDANVWGFGFSYAYKKAVSQQAPFSDINFGEDYDFVNKLRQHPFTLQTAPDTTGLVLHLLHMTNLSCIFPQYRLPSTLLPAVFGSGISQCDYIKPPLL